MATTVTCNVCGSDVKIADGASFGICELCGQTSAIAVATVGTAVKCATPGVDSLMNLGWFFLQEGNWRQADECFDRVRNIEPEYAPVYVGRLCSRLTRIVCKRLFRPKPL